MNRSRTAGIQAPPRPGSPSALRELNRVRVLEVIRANAGLAQIEVARMTGLAPATISNIVRILVASGEVVLEQGTGRRQLIRPARRTGYLVGIDCGHEHTTVAVADRSHEVLSEQREETPGLAPAQERLSRAAALVRQVLEAAAVDVSDVVGAGLGLPAPIDQKSGRVGSPTILPGWIGVRIGDIADETLGLPVSVAVDNDANLGALAEARWGAGQGHDNLVYVKVADGVGAGLMVNGRLYSGAAGTAGEIGHTTVDEFGDVCRCGNRGCLETFVSSRHVVSLLAQTHADPLTVSGVVSLARGGDRACLRVLEDAGRQLGRSLADVCSVLNPEMIILGGELAQATDLMAPVIRHMVRRCGVPSAADIVDIRPADLGARSQVVGAMGLAQDMVTEAPAIFTT